jgi:hypothetical protein
MSQLFYFPTYQALSSSGTTLAGAKLYFYVTGTATASPVYTDATRTTALANPVVADSQGRFPQIYPNPDVVYRAVLTDSGGTQQWLQDAVSVQVFPRATSEVADGSFPANYTYPAVPFIDVRRYGARCDGVTDDTTALQTALLSSSRLGLSLVIPYRCALKITSYVEVPSNTTLYLLGTLQLTNRQSGLFCNNAANIKILGEKSGTITDSVVAAPQVFGAITAITRAASAVVTISTVSGANPFSLGQQLGISGISAGMEQINSMAGIVQAIGGSSGAWTVTLDINSSGFSSYTSGGVLSSGYFWNPGRENTAPSIHIRSSQHVLVDGLNVTYVSQGIFISNASQNYVTNAFFNPSQAYPVDVTVQNCTTTFCEWSGLATLSCYDSRCLNNYVYRCGDGGLWMMAGMDTEVIGNHRISPATSYSSVTMYGANNAQHSDTWNDGQGMQFENCHGLLISGNVVKYMWAEGIDIKQGCNRVLVTQNRVSNCEQTSIIVREGDPGDVNACWKISIIGNTISNHGYVLFNKPIGTAGAIVASSCFVTEIINNVIYSYQGSPAINCTGPGNYLGSNYGSKPTDPGYNPHQAALIISGNNVDFKSTFNQTDPTEFNYTSATPTAIQVSGYYDSVHIAGNKVTADYYLGGDSRINGTYAITLVYSSANSTFYPLNAKIDGNTISGWGGAGISVTGLAAVSVSGLSICNNNIGAIGEAAITVTACSYCNISGNVIAQINGGNIPAISISGTATTYVQSPICCNNQISGGWQTGGNGMAYGIALSYVSNGCFTNNVIVNAASGAFNIGTFSGNLNLQGSTGFPRSGATSPNGNVLAYYMGEPYLVTGTNTWYFAASGASTAWYT